ncbi:uncharacterized protein AB675_4301 [Cyphellophora attinorum]|uniref:DUF7918 domain-containing protein n=1 Tax=Cyphellophora attinorum TaxID=1664694 RepID=A0A0N1NYD4_9EURO|nr:uncharacterized protein AB675_4301 [Phialophora attinorum]KPI38486.1 hypothetical protein AB675_4301 [Phialophora attinorum]
MPSLRKINCNVLWPQGTPFKEYATTYGDGIVETFIAVPGDKPQKFSIRVTSKGYIYEGLAAVVFVDGVYQCNRNRVNLVRPKKNLPLERTEIDFYLRQEERKLTEDGHFLGSDWRFDDFNPFDEATSDEEKSATEHLQNLGTIDVIILRCCARKDDDTAEDDCDSAAESDVLGNRLTVEDDEAAYEKKAKNKGGKGNNDALNQNKSSKKKGGKKDDDTASIIQLDGPADSYYHRPNPPYDTPGWAGPPTGRFQHRPPLPPRADRHVHFDIQRDHSQPPADRYTDRAQTPYAHAAHVPGLSQYQSHAAYPNYGAPHYPTPPHTAGHPYYAGHNQYPPYAQNWSSHYPAQHSQTVQPTQTMPGAWPQPNNGAGQQPNLRWVQPKAPETRDGNNNNTAHKQATNGNTQPATIDPYSGWYWDGTQWQYGIVGVSKQAMDANNTNGQSNGSGDSSNDTSNNGWDNNNDTSGTNNNDSTNDWDNSNDTTGTNNNDTSWDNANDNKDTNNNDTSWDNDDKKSTSGNGGTDWNNTNNNADTSGAASTGNNDWGTPAPADNTVHTLNPSDSSHDNSNNNNNNNNVSASTPAGNYKGPPLHGPHGAYHGPKLAVAAPSIWVIDEPAPYDVPAYFAASRSLSKQIQRGRAYNYFKRHRKPIYIDSIAEPYARFVFKYRTKENLPKGLKVEAAEEPNPDQGLQDLQDKGREELIEELRRFRKVYGEQAPDITDVGKHEGDAEDENDAMEWKATPPEKSFLDYKLPVYYGNGEGGDANGNVNSNGSVLGNGKGKTNGNGAGKKADDGWATDTPANTNAGGNSWDTGGGGGGNSGTTW